MSLPHRGGSTSAQLFRSADGDRVRLPATLNSGLNPHAEATWNPLRRLVYPPCIMSFRSLSLGSPAAPHGHGHQGRRAARMQISEGPRDAPPAGIKGGAGRAPDLRSRCLPGAGRALPRSLLPRVPARHLQLSQSPVAPGKDSKPSCYKSQGWGASCRGRNERGATSVPSVGRTRTSVGPRGPGVHFLNGNMGNGRPHHTLPGLAGGISPGGESCVLASLSPGAIHSGQKEQLLVCARLAGTGRVSSR